MAHNSIYQTDAINLTNSGRTKGVTNEALVEIGKYFKTVKIGERRNNLGQKWLSFYAPLISLFTNKEYRDSYLEYTTSVANESTIALRAILADDKLRKKYYVTMINNIGLSCESANIPAYTISTHSYTKENAASGGKTHKYYLSVKGIPCNDKRYTDLTEIYSKICEMRTNGEKVANGKNCVNRKAE